MKEELTLAKAIKRIAWGYILIHCGINLGVIDILPDFAGYFLMYMAIEEISKEEESIALLKPLGKILIGWELLVWATKFEGWDLSAFPFVIVLSVIEIYFHFQMLTNIASVAEKHGSEKKKSILNVRTIQTLFHTILIAILYLELLGGWSIFFGVLGFIAVIWTCIVLFNLAAELENEVIA